jgi:FSR family fosmidomycin resistance protein-like MFS transporter
MVLLAIEFLDEFVFGAQEAAWPLLRTDLNLSYSQVGLLLGVPSLVSSLVEPFLGILGDIWKRRVLVLGGGVLFALSLLLTAASTSFLPLLVSFALFYPASGAFVSLSQANLMDVDPARHEQNMARWTFAGSLGVVAGPLALAGSLALGGGWRELYLLFAGLTLVLLVVLIRRHPQGRGGHHRVTPPEGPGDSGWTRFREGLISALGALRRGEVLRWLTLLQFSDLMLDVLLGFLALYMVDVVGTTPAQAGTAVAVWTVCGLVGDLLLIPLLERVAGLRYLRVSAGLEMVLFPLFLLVPTLWVRYLLLGLLGLFNAGWYSILKARLYSSMPGQSGTVMTVSNLFGLAGGLVPLGLGVVAERVDLRWAMWLLMLGPVALLIGLARDAELRKGSA